MSNELLLGLIGGLFLIIGYFLNKALNKIDTVSDNVNKLLTVQGIGDEKIKTFEEQIKTISDDQKANSEKWIILYKDHNMHSIRNK